MRTATTTAVPPMGTAISKSAVATAIAIAIALAGCGGRGSGTGAATGAPSGTDSAVAGAASPTATGGAFSWLRPTAAPAAWLTTSIPTGATLSYPPGWSHVHGDKGSATAELFGHQDQILGFLNVTPRQGAETPTNWTHFRAEHNAEEGDRAVRVLASAKRLRFRTGTGSCVKDSYRTITHARYIELACLVAGRRASTVIVGAAPPDAWPRVSALLERSISSLTT